MLHEKSAGAVIFNVEGSIVEYLVLQYLHKGWEFARGAIEAGESELKAAQREIHEETGLKDLDYIDGFREINSWFYNNSKEKTVHKEAIFFLAKSTSQDVKLSPEHSDYRWLPFREAHNQLTFTKSKMILTQAHHYIEKHQLNS